MTTTELAQLFNMNPAERLFNDIHARCLRLWTFILSFRITSAEGMAGARERIAAQKITFVGELLKGSEYDRIFIDKEAFFAANPADKLVAEMTEATIAHSQLAVDTSSIIFAHSVLDGAAFDYCRVTALAAPTDWEPLIEGRRLSLSEIRGHEYDQLLTAKIDEFLAQLERESLLKKADLLLARCQPPEKWSPMNNYRYDRKRLERLDSYRHAAIHGSGLGKGIAAADDEIDYLMRTALYFMGLVNLRYKLNAGSALRFRSDARAVENKNSA